jgi:hypothetical protein
MQFHLSLPIMNFVVVVVVVVVVETPFYLQFVYIHSANWCEDWVLWLGEVHSVVPFRSS